MTVLVYRVYWIWKQCDNHYCFDKTIPSEFIHWCVDACIVLFSVGLLRFFVIFGLVFLYACNTIQLRKLTFLKYLQLQ